MLCFGKPWHFISMPLIIQNFSEIQFHHPAESPIAGNFKQITNLLVTKVISLSKVQLAAISMCMIRPLKRKKKISSQLQNGKVLNYEMIWPLWSKKKKSS